MAVRKPLEKFSPINIDALISKGAPVREDNKNTTEKKDATYINLRVPTNMLDNINEAMNERVGISRNAWILEAIHEKLKKY